MNKQNTPMQSPKEAPAIKETRKFLNRISLIGILIASAAGTALYVYNVMIVNRMLNDIRGLEKRRDSMITINQHLRTKVLDLQSASRITGIAKNKLGMMPNPKAPSSVQQ